ncbi:rod shape-determining protein MreD [Candidatus Parcubacteria bacterium]|nr:MAG: rod shape-determining protein MreD [Candidatus Parcubacteria bacterium]
MNYLKIASKFFLLLSLLVFQVSFISGLPAWVSNLNLILLVLILILGFSSYRRSLMWAMGIGLLFDMYHFTFFGVNTISLLLALYLTNFLLENLLTNRSLYTFIFLTIFASAIFQLNVIFLNLVFGFLKGYEAVYSFSNIFWLDELKKIIVNVVFIFFLFYVVSFFSKRFKPMFLVK